jgi:cellulose synthase/poly-beta-1,6-N-acetylglucosamine synthase-like glycosyltransferase
MTVVVITCLLLTICYVLLMLAYKNGWARQKEFELPANFQPSTFISVIIPARNEGGNIASCLDSILNQDYPKDLFEIVVVDDHSEDDTVRVVKTYSENNVRCISLADSLEPGKKIHAYKKAALAAGIAKSKGSLIVTTDADCIAPPSWLRDVAAIYEAEKPAMIVAPVIYSVDGSLVQLFQLIDFMSMQGITAASHALKLGNMSNGANLAFSRTAFEQVGGYAGIDHLASGDDYLLMMKMSELTPGGISYLKSSKAIISTLPQPDWRSFLQQRIRWASKSGKYNDRRLTAILLLVYLFNLQLLLLFAAGIFMHQLLAVGAAILLTKILTEYFLIVPVARFFRSTIGDEIYRKMLLCFPLLQPLHIVYIVLAGLLGFIGVYEWKGRRVR